MHTLRPQGQCEKHPGDHAPRQVPQEPPPPLPQGQLPRWLMFREEQRGQLPPEWSHMEFHALDSELLP